ncbi:M1 family metallopeptidase [Longispora albida]|uniref:M1 family metallopeptidase n=1 Tax=Longispora albida TaxID=203523 RepID=UPI00059054F3|nr:M1 family metallopeptidase [Longispora albida]
MSLRRAAVALVAASGLVLSMTAASSGKEPVPGAAGIGDSYYPDYGNGGYDVEHYDIDVAYTPATDHLSGRATIKARATQQRLKSFNLDFALDVSAVSLNGKPVAFRKEGAHEIVVTPDCELKRHEKFTVVVEYSGVPSTVKVDGFTSWKRTGDGALAVNEPEISWWWYPSNDHPLDKALFDVSVTVPDGVEAISNGVLTGAPVSSGGRTTWDWHSAKPQATYLTFLAIGQYEIETSTAPNGQLVYNAYSENLGALKENAKVSLRRTAEVVQWGESMFGPYPYEAQGGVAGPLDGIGFALETQTRPVYGYRFWQNGPNVSVVVHEIAHQWFGNSVSVADWKYIWLSEGFARYAEWLWMETHGGDTAQLSFENAYNRFPADNPFWQVLPGDPGPDNQFSGAVYNRGAMALHEIRLALGDQKFFAVLKGWTKHKQHKNATIAEFKAYAERLSGKDLTPVFDTWLYYKGRPVR